MLWEFATSVQQYPELALEAAWKGEHSHTSDNVRALLNSSSLLALQEQGSVTLKQAEAQLLLLDGGRPAVEVDKALSGCWQLALHKWQLLPRLSSSQPAHVPLLQSFHCLQQLKDAFVLLEDANRQLASLQGQPSAASVPNLRNGLKNWRERLPNDWDCLSHWDDIMCWRLQVHTHTYTIFIG